MRHCWQEDRQVLSGRPLYGTFKTYKNILIKTLTVISLEILYIEWSPISCGKIASFLRLEEESVWSSILFNGNYKITLPWLFKLKWKDFFCLSLYSLKVEKLHRFNLLDQDISMRKFGGWFGRWKNVTILIWINLIVDFSLQQQKRTRPIHLLFEYRIIFFYLNWSEIF